MANDMTPQGGRSEKQPINHFKDAARDTDANIHDESAQDFEDKLAKAGSLEALMASDDADKVNESALERERKRRDEVTDAQREDEKTQSGFSEKFKEAAEGGPTDGMAYTGSHIRDFVSYGIKDKGSYYHFNNEKVTDKQLRRMILRGHLDKGWNTLYFYDKKGKIDRELTAIGASVSASSNRMDEMEPFLKGNPVAHLQRAMEKIGQKWESNKQEWKNSGLPIPLLNSEKNGGAAAWVR